MKNNEKSTILVCRIPPRLKRRVEKASKDWGCKSSSDAVRQLLEYGLLFADAIDKEPHDPGFLPLLDKPVQPTRS